MMDAETPPEPPQAAAPEPIMDRREPRDRRQGERRRRQVPVAEDRRAGGERRQGERRRRSINQYDLSPEEIAFIHAVNRFRERTGNRFPTARQILGIIRDLGYEKRE